MKEFPSSNSYQPVIGFEIHVELKTKSKMFGRAANDPDQEQPNVDIDEVNTGQPGTLQIRLVDPLTQGARDGLGACTGDSGGPVFEDRQGGPAIVGVVSWSTGANGAAGCGGLTGVTPLTLYRDWILQIARQWGAGL